MWERSFGVRGSHWTLLLVALALGILLLELNPAGARMNQPTSSLALLETTNYPNELVHLQDSDSLSVDQKPQPFTMPKPNASPVPLDIESVPSTENPSTVPVEPIPSTESQSIVPAQPVPASPPATQSENPNGNLPAVKQNQFPQNSWKNPSNQ